MTQVIAGIDEAGYGPKLGPLTAGRCVLVLEDASLGPEDWPDVWARLHEVVCRKPRDPQRRIAVADSKKLTVSGKHGHAAVPHLERAVLAFASLDQAEGVRFESIAELLSALGSEHHRRPELPRWYGRHEDEAAEDWGALPAAGPRDGGRLALDAEALGMDAGWLRRACRAVGVRPAAGGALGVAVACEDVFNRRLAQAGHGSKAAVSFALIAHHLRRVWEQHGSAHPRVVVDRQGGRVRYSAALSRALPGASVRILRESPEASEYELLNGPNRAMRVRFQPKADDEHFCVALASMTAKYVRELYMHRLQRWWLQRLPDVKSTAGYGTDANRFLAEVTPHLDALGVRREQLVRRA